MTKKDYIVIAGWFHTLHVDCSSNRAGVIRPITFEKVVDKVMEDLKRDNPHFDRQRFLSAVQEGK